MINLKNIQIFSLLVFASFSIPLQAAQDSTEQGNADINTNDGGTETDRVMFYAERDGFEHIQFAYLVSVDTTLEDLIKKIITNDKYIPEGYSKLSGKALFNQFINYYKKIGFLSSKSLNSDKKILFSEVTEDEIQKNYKKTLQKLLKGKEVEISNEKMTWRNIIKKESSKETGNFLSNQEIKFDNNIEKVYTEYKELSILMFDRIERKEKQYMVGTIYDKKRGTLLPGQLHKKNTDLKNINVMVMNKNDIDHTYRLVQLQKEINLYNTFEDLLSELQQKIEKSFDTNIDSKHQLGGIINRLVQFPKGIDRNTFHGRFNELQQEKEKKLLDTSIYPKGELERIFQNYTTQQEIFKSLFKKDSSRLRRGSEAVIGSIDKVKSMIFKDDRGFIQVGSKEGSKTAKDDNDIPKERSQKKKTIRFCFILKVISDPQRDDHYKRFLIPTDRMSFLQGFSEKEYDLKNIFIMASDEQKFYRVGLKNNINEYLYKDLYNEVEATIGQSIFEIDKTDEQTSEVIEKLFNETVQKGKNNREYNNVQKIVDSDDTDKKDSTGYSSACKGITITSTLFLTISTAVGTFFYYKKKDKKKRSSR